MLLKMYVIGLAFFLLGMMIFWGGYYGCRWLGRKISDRKEIEE